VLDTWSDTQIAAPTRTSVAVVILTWNEEAHIERAIRSVQELASDILVVDSYSTDATVAIAKAAGARVLQNPFVHQAQQFNWALDSGGLAADWILRLDADEVIEHDLRANIRGFLLTATPDVAAVNFKRKHIFMGRWIRHGGRYPLTLLRMWRRGRGRAEDRWMDEHMVAWGGRTVTLDGGFADISLHDISRFTDKHNKYATREAVQILCGKYGIKIANSAANVGGQALFKRVTKTGIYYRLPVLIAPSLYFIYRYFIRAGFLDGRPGLIYHVLQGYWYRFLVGAKVVELQRELEGCADTQSRLARIRRLTGLAVEATA
jgi:glycosyltransferase involved in cell wall biosynthesis